MRRMRRAKIIATLGPASHEEQMIEELAKAGADVFRINMSHASHDVLHQTVARIRAVEKKLNHPLGILVDLQGPKLRVWKFTDGAVNLVAGQKFTLDSDKNDSGNAERVYLPHPEIIESVSVGDRLLLDDGKLALKATKVGGGAIETEVIYGGKLSDKKGVSLPDTLLPTGALTEKDHADLLEGLKAEADWIALSFVQRPEDLIDVRKIVQGRAGVMAKIEKPQAVERLEDWRWSDVRRAAPEEQLANALRRYGLSRPIRAVAFGCRRKSRIRSSKSGRLAQGAIRGPIRRTAAPCRPGRPRAAGASP